MSPSEGGPRYRVHLEATIVEAAILHPEHARALADNVGPWMASDHLRQVLDAAAAAADNGEGGYWPTHLRLKAAGVHRRDEDWFELLHLDGGTEPLPTSRLWTYVDHLLDRAERQALADALARAHDACRNAAPVEVLRRLRVELEHLGLTA